jgi:hypothetical protein
MLPSPTSLAWVVFADNEDYELKGELTSNAGVNLFIGMRSPFIALKFKKDLQIDPAGKFLG